LTIEEFLKLQKELTQEEAQELSSEKEEAWEGVASSSEIRKVLGMFENVNAFLEKHHPDKALFKRSYMVHFHNYHPGDPMPHLSAPAAIALIVCSSFLPMLVVYPANLLRTRFQASTCSKPMPIIGTARDIYRADGTLGLYRGFLTSLSKTLPSVTISYLTFEFCMELMHLPTLGSR
uniref:Solute carrier family 25 (Mitochondrial carnitine/acylcarnitine transporter), member 20/29 n=1 Tax=Schistocephalus solidus TaxID=70667 RepID=A0A183TP17_SCHSO